ncbi:cyclin-D3-1-like [Silene latifolia]|uniref:cyclin-D3-1-like n=1 Tax=Silene latifolia TaxID=37657 RepID=UPI003D7852D5
MAFYDELYCEEEKWENDDDEENTDFGNLMPLMLLEQDLFWEDEELQSLFIKEKNQGIFNNNNNNNKNINISLICGRKEAVEWMLKVNSYYGFSALTSILGVNYFDRCISSDISIIQEDKPWTIQLAAVTCLSLAAKVEETHVPFLLDLQVEGARPIFEPRDIQKMEILVLSTLEWKMHPVTSISFLDHIIRRLGLKNHLHWEFLRKCEDLLLSLLSDWRFVNYLPSVLATATMMHVIDQIEHCNPLEYQTQLLNVLNISKENVKDCYDQIVETSSRRIESDIPNYKRKFEQMMMNNNSNTIPSSPSGVMDAYCFSSDSSNDSWGVATSIDTGGRMSVSSSSPMIRKKGRVHEQPMTLQLPSLSRVFVDVVESPH